MKVDSEQLQRRWRHAIRRAGLRGVIEPTARIQPQSAGFEMTVAGIIIANGEAKAIRLEPARESDEMDINKLDKELDEAARQISAWVRENAGRVDA